MTTRYVENKDDDVAKRAALLVGIALGHRGGNVRLHYLLYLATAIRIVNKVLYSHSGVFSWVCVDDCSLYDVFIRKLSDDYVDNLLLRFCDPHPTHHVHELIDACKERFRVFVGVHCDVLQLLDKEGFLCLRRR